MLKRVTAFEFLFKEVCDLEVIIIIIFIIMAYTKDASTEQKKLVKLPVGRNSEGYFDDKAFTQINLTLKEGRNNG